MILFLDTSSLFKMYHKEDDTPKFIQFVAEKKVTKIFLSELAQIEFASIIWRKVRMGEFTETETKEISRLFEKDFTKYSFIPIGKNLLNTANKLIDTYGILGLRTLDSIQMATAVSLKHECDMFITSDKLMNNLFQQESLPVPA